MKARWFGRAVMAVGIIGACVEGGTNFNQKAPGNGAAGGGVRVGLGEIAVSPDGRYFASARSGVLMVGSAQSCRLEALPVREPNRIAFDTKGEVAFVTSLETQEVVALRLATREVLWRRPSKVVALGGWPELRVAPGDAQLLWVHETSIDVVDAASGRPVRTEQLPRPIVDVDFLGGDEVAVTLREVWDGEGERAQVSTVIRIWSTAQGGSTDIAVPNCASRLMVSPIEVTPAPRLAQFWAGSAAPRRQAAPARFEATPGPGSGLAAPTRYAFLAPTTCQRDPISVIDLTNRRFVENLPGFGPVTLSPDGSTVIGFLDHGTQASPRYALMFVNTATLQFDEVPVGDVLPRYTITPDGTVLLVDASRWVADELRGARVLDVEARRFRPLAGPRVSLDDFALTTDSQRAYVASEGHLFTLDLKRATVAKVELPYGVQTLNISPDDTLLYLHDEARNVRLYEPASAKQRCAVEAVVEPR